MHKYNEALRIYNNIHSRHTYFLEILLLFDKNDILKILWYLVNNLIKDR
jgi:hypothetical protein